MDEHEVERPLADDLVGDPDVAAARVARRRRAAARPRRFRRPRAWHALRARRQLERRVLLQHPPLELAQRRRRLDPELVGERAPERLVARERLGVPARPVEREHVLRAEALAQRVLRDQRLELADDVAVIARARGRPRAATRARRGEAPRAARPRAARTARANSASAGPRQSASASPSSVRACRASPCDERLPAVGDRALEAREVELVVADLEQRSPARACAGAAPGSAFRSCETWICTIFWAESGTSSPQSASTIRSRATRAVRVQEQDREQRPLLAAAHLQLRAGERLQRAEEPKVHTPAARTYHGVGAIYRPPTREQPSASRVPLLLAPTRPASERRGQWRQGDQ